MTTELDFERIAQGFFRDEDGEELITKAAEEMLRASAKVTDSPIEAIFLAAYRILGGVLNLKAKTGLARGVFVCSNGDDFSALPPNAYAVVPQFQWRQYRIDFALFIGPHGFANPLFVECDGHEFHERTPEQAEHDRSRDREIQTAGIPVIRFTGREIHRAPLRCAMEAFHLTAKLRIERGAA